MPRLLLLLLLTLPFRLLAQEVRTAEIKPADSLGTTVANDTLCYVETGTASWYGKKAEGHRTASGEIFHADSLTAAHKTLPMGTLVRVTNLQNDSVVIVKINDRLPKSTKSRCIDLTSGAARKLGYLRAGLAPVKIEVIGEAPVYRKPKR